MLKSATIIFFQGDDYDNVHISCRNGKCKEVRRCSDSRNCDEKIQVQVNSGQKEEGDHRRIAKEREDRYLNQIQQDCPFLRDRWFRAKDKGEMDGKNDRKLARKVDRWIRKAKENNKC